MNEIVARLGSITYGTYGQKTVPEILERGVQALFDKEIAVRGRTNLMALKQAMIDHFSASEDMVRPLADKEKNGYTVVREERGASHNEYMHRVSLTVDENLIVRATEGYCDTYEVQRLTNEYKLLIPGAAVSELVVKLVAIVNGLPLRPSGGIYFIPKDETPRWRKFCEVVESAGQGHNRMTVLPMEMNDLTLRDIACSITEEVVAAAKSMKQERLKNELGDRAIQNRIQKSGEWLKKIRKYEDMLGGTLRQCRSALTEAVESYSVAGAIKDDQEIFAGEF